VGLAEALGADPPPKSLMEFFGGLVFSGGSITCPVDDPSPLEGAEIDLDALPSQFVARTPEGIRVLVAGKMGDLGPGAGCDGPIAKIARDLRVADTDGRPPLILDFKAGFEDSARGALTGLDWMIVVVDPTVAAVHMAVHLAQMHGKIQDGVPPATAHLDDPVLVETALRQFRESRVRGISAILNRIPDSDTEAFLRGKLGALGGPPVLGTLPEGPELQSQWLRGGAVKDYSHPNKIEALVLALERVMAPIPVTV
jgi:CO dehydrogenase nickel-insertion accessory protein CooC1